MTSVLFTKIAGGCLFSGLVGLMAVKGFGLYNSYQYGDIYIYAYADAADNTEAEARAKRSVKNSDDTTTTAQVKDVTVPVVPAPADSPVDTEKPAEETYKQTNCTCKLKDSKNQVSVDGSFSCSLKKAKITFTKKQTTKTEIIKAISENKEETSQITDLATDVDNIFRIDVAGEMTGFKNTDKKIELTTDDDGNKKTSTLTILFSTDHRDKALVSQSKNFVVKEAKFEGSKIELTKSTSYACSFIKLQPKYKECKVYSFADTIGTKHKDLEFKKPKANGAESTNIEANKNYIVELNDYESSLTQSWTSTPVTGTLFIKNVATPAEIATLTYIQSLYHSTDNLITLE